MKIFHLSDLHIGKRVNGFSLLPDQAHILLQILQHVDEQHPHVVLIAGDVYDKTIPPAEAVLLFDQFLSDLVARNTPVCIISGNHDSPERLSFAARILQNQQVYIASGYNASHNGISNSDAQDAVVTLTDSYGMVDFHLLPYLKPAQVRACFPDAEIANYTDALAVAVAHMPLAPNRRHVLVTHQFVTYGTQAISLSDSETHAIGGLDTVDGHVFDAFDYVALGHLHAPQQVGRPSMRYGGTPLKYSFSEVHHNKVLTMATLGENGQVTITPLPLVPLHDMRILRGTYAELTDKAIYDGTATDDYLQIVLTDEEDILHALDRLRIIYPNIMKLDYDNLRTRQNQTVNALPHLEERTALQLFDNFYQLQNNQPFSAAQTAYLTDLLSRLEVL